MARLESHKDSVYLEKAKKRFWAKVKKTESCWLWIGCKYKGGSGQFSYNGKILLAHNFVWSVNFGAIPKGKRVSQRCRNRSCVKPTHLFLEDKGWEVRFWKKVNICEDGCWEWSGHKRNGYGLFNRIKDKTESAHRIVWELVNGPIPDGKHVLHRCDNPPCCNPLHLFLGTAEDNMGDMVKKNRQWKKITDEEVIEIRKRYDRGGIAQDKLAEEFGIKQMQISRIIRRKRRKKVY